ncbi:MAG: hydroxymethylbilane synthase [Schleiferiaceae bacterium]
MDDRKLRIASRTSPLALFQTEAVMDLLHKAHLGLDCTLVPISTKGDKDQSTSLQNLGQTGIFTIALDDAILEDKADIGVHSLKDYPTNVPKGLKLLAVLPRDGYLDAFIPGNNGKSKQEVLTILSGSPRRRAFWLHKYPHHSFKDLRGNMHTRVEKILASDGGIVSAPGLARINLLPENAELLDWMLPAPAQGVMAIVGRDNDPKLEAMLSAINDQETYICARVERDFMAAVETGCASPLGALCRPTRGGFSFEGALLSLDGQKKLTVSRTVTTTDWQKAGYTAAQELLNNGGSVLMEEIRAQQPKDILCLKEIDQKQRRLALEIGLKLHDVEVLDLVPITFEIKAADIAMAASSFGAEQLEDHIKDLPESIWIVGQKATDVLKNSGYSGRITTYGNSGEMVEAYQKEQPGTAVYYGAERTSQNWAEHGIQHITTYRNSAKPPRLARQQWDAILAFSPLGVQSALQENDFPKNTPVICIGERTAEAVKTNDFTNVIAAAKPDFTTLLQTLKNELK